ncbi:hypothetical protein PTSG_04301 [Salpingoeca rosetta]|uniref:Uncharacterized protein n=1 Tax=Salpingoeca rosetta (strain ATCC 50818 / BSB-021) TaxID=946362 RepID=F2U764_SALR5|nr:uncharacterized protein PTSG_04301 [Salpingoeca rosetta]EGD83696.1 hypothetical protein PTSG_04301 [Salpingoeca rosetta]|eukprot:XP_004995200.1 hypothetical protein PTSG_04301 [Salpingoeca rosetta]
MLSFSLSLLLCTHTRPTLHKEPKTTTAMSDVVPTNPSTWPRWLQITAAAAGVGAVATAAYVVLKRPDLSSKELSGGATTARSAPTTTTTAAPQTRGTAQPVTSTPTSDAEQAADEERSALKAKANAFRKKGNEAYKARRFDDAINAYTKALETAPVVDEDCAVYYCNRAACYLFQKKYDKVIEDCTAALRLRPLYTKALNRRAQAYENKSKFRSALKDFTTILLIDKFQNEAASKAVERLLEMLGRRGAAKYLETKPKQLPARKVMVSFFDNFGPTTFGPEETGSVEELKQQLQEKPGNGDILAHLCKAHLRDQDFEAAYETCKTAVDALQEMKLENGRKETLVSAMNILGSFQMLRLELQEAERTFSEALRFNKRNANTLIRLAACRLELGRTSEALTDFTTAQRLDDKNPDVYFHKAQAHISMGAAVMAFSDLQRAIKLGTKVYGPYVHLALLHLQTQDAKSAIDLMQEAVTKFPEVSTVHSYLGEIYSAVGDNDKAVECFDKAISLDPHNANPYVHKGLVFVQQGNMEQGIELIHKAIEVDDACESAYARLAQIHVQREEYEEALKCYDKAIAATHAGQELVAFFSCKEACVAQQAVVKAHPELRPTEVQNM